jgi:hypothetical protein
MDRLTALFSICFGQREVKNLERKEFDMYILLLGRFLEGE